jgi:hypothetical protein
LLFATTRLQRLDPGGSLHELPIPSLLVREGPGGLWLGTAGGMTGVWRTDGELVDNLPLILGTDYGIVAFSFNPAEGPNEAAEKRDSVLKRLKAQPVPLNGWRFLTGDGKAIAALNSQLGFRVRMADQEFEHSSAIFVAGPNGTVARHFTGVEFDPRKVAAAIKDAR